MFESFIIMLREGVEVALIVGLMWVYLRKTGRQALIPAVLWGLGGGVAASLVLAWGLRFLDWSAPIVEGTMMFVATAFVISMVLWMLGHAREISGQIKERIETLSSERAQKGAFWGVALFTLVMVAREGFETVVFMAAVWAGDNANILGGIGALLGIGLAVVFGVLFIRGSVHIDLSRFFKITGIVLMIFIVQLIAYGFHEYGEAGLMGWLPEPVMEGIDEVAQNNILFILAILAIPALMLVIPSSKREVNASERTWRVVGALATFLIIGLLGFWEIGTRAQASENGIQTLRPKLGQVEIELDDLTPGQATVFNVPEDGRVLTLVIDLADDAEALPLVATGQAGPSRQYGRLAGKLIFYNEDEAFNPTHYEKAHIVNLQPVPFELEGDEVLVDVEELEHAGE